MSSRLRQAAFARRSGRLDPPGACLEQDDQQDDDQDDDERSDTDVHVISPFSDEPPHEQQRGRDDCHDGPDDKGDPTQQHERGP
jgi:hypothetical protein